MEQLLAIRVSVPQARSWADRCLARAVAPLPSGGRKDAPQGPNKKQKDEAKTIGFFSSPWSSVHFSEEAKTKAPPRRGRCKSIQPLRSTSRFP
jgi:hypothetical protein